MSEYGKKGGTSKNSGKKGSRFSVLLPDGTKATKMSFDVHSEKAFAGVYYSERDCKWFVSGIANEPKDWHGQIFVEAVNETLLAARAYSKAVMEGMSHGKRK